MCLVPFRSSRWNVGLPFSRCSGQGPHLSMLKEPRLFSRVAVGFSSYDGTFRLPVVLAQEVQSSTGLVREIWGLLSSHCRAKRPHLCLCPGHTVPLQGGLRLEFLCETRLILRCDGKIGNPFHQSRGIDSPVEIRRGEGALMKWCREPRCSSRVRPVCRVTFGVASRVLSTVSKFKMERGTSLEML